MNSPHQTPRRGAALPRRLGAARPCRPAAALPRWLAAALAALLLLPGAPARAADDCPRRPLDLVLVLDDSFSMSRESDEQNDPDNLRITAAHLMVDLLDPDDRVGLVLFSTAPDQAVAPAPLAQARAALHRQIDGFRSRGGTRLDRALAAGLELLPPAPDRQQALLFLTDGRPDTDPDAQGARLLELAARARERQVALHIIGLGPRYDRDLLEQMAARSRSQQFWPVQRPQDLGTAFLQVLQDLKGLDIQASTAGQATVPGLGPEVRFAVLRRRADPPQVVDWAPGRLVGRPAVAAPAPGVTYGYDLLVYKPAAPATAVARATAPVFWAVQQPPVRVWFTEPAARQEVAAGEPLPVRVALAPCGGALPPGLRGEVTVLDAARRPTPQAAALAPDPDRPDLLAGELPAAPAGGTHILQVRLLSPDGQPVAEAGQTVSAVPRSRWVLEVPPALAPGATGAVTVRHTFGGRPAPADPGPLLARFPDGSQAAIPLRPGDSPGTWAGSFTAPPGRPGRVEFTLGAGLARAATEAAEVRFELDPPPPVQWSFLAAWLGRARPLLLTGRATGPVAAPDLLPPLAAEGPVVLDPGPWAPDGDGYRALATVQPGPGARPSLLRWQDLLRGRPLEWRLAPRPGPYLPAAPVTVRGQVAPLLPWPWPLLLPAGLAAAGVLVYRRLCAGPQLRLAIGPAGGPLVNLMDRRPSALARLLSREHQQAITVGGPESPARVRLPGLPPGALLAVRAREPAGREQFQVRNLNPAVPLYEGAWPRQQVTLTRPGPRLPLQVGAVAMEVKLNPARRGARSRR